MSIGVWEKSIIVHPESTAGHLKVMMLDLHRKQTVRFYPLGRRPTSALDGCCMKCHGPVPEATEICHLFHLKEFSFCVTKLQRLSIISYHDREIIISQETILSKFFKVFQFSDSRTKQQTRLPFSSKQGRTHDRSISSSSPINLHASSGSKLPSIKRDDNLSHCKEPKRARLIICTMAILSSGLALIRPSLLGT